MAESFKPLTLDDLIVDMCGEFINAVFLAYIFRFYCIFNYKILYLIYYKSAPNYHESLSAFTETLMR